MPALTDLEVRNALLAEGKNEQLLSDSNGLNLLLRKGVKGLTKTWLFRYTFNCEERRLTLGHYSKPGGKFELMTLAQARELAAEKVRLVAQGIDPKVATVTDRITQELIGERPASFRALAEQWLNDSTTKKKLSSDTLAAKHALLNKHVYPHIGELPPEHLNPPFVDGVLSKIHAGGFTRTCGLALSTIRAAVHYGIKKGFLSGDCTATIKAEDYDGQSKDRTRNLSPYEIQLLAHLLRASTIQPRWQHAIWLILATGNRVGETTLTEVVHVTLAKRDWFFPKENRKHPKGKMPRFDRNVFLSAFALPHMEALLAMKPGKYLLPNTRPTKNSKNGHASLQTITHLIEDRQPSESRKTTRRTLETDMLELPGGKWTTHDLRRTMATRMASLDIPEDIINHCISHEKQDTYIHEQRHKEMKDAWEKWGGELQRLLNEAFAVDEHGKPTPLNKELAAIAKARKDGMAATRALQYAARGKSLKKVAANRKAASTAGQTESEELAA